MHMSVLRHNSNIFVNPQLLILQTTFVYIFTGSVSPDPSNDHLKTNGTAHVIKVPDAYARTIKPV